MASISSILAASAYLLTSANALAISTSLVGTWTTKSAAVLTGPGFYNPINDSFIEPRLTGISYSFTADGHFETAYYRAIANPTTPTCPSSILQFQHGTVVATSSGGLTLTPIAVDGREQLSSPCTAVGKKGHSTYTHYKQVENMLKWQVSVDAYSGATRLDLYNFDGTPLHPMYLAYSPPLMLPTVTMNPTATASSTAAATAKVKRWLGLEASEESERIEGKEVPLNRESTHIVRRDGVLDVVQPEHVWWLGVGMTALGGVAYLL